MSQNEPEAAGPFHNGHSPSFIKMRDIKKNVENPPTILKRLSRENKKQKNQMESLRKPAEIYD